MWSRMMTLICVIDIIILGIVCIGLYLIIKNWN